MSRTNCAIGKDVVPASFKGVVFWCTEADITGGRRGAEGEFPFGEETAYADLGRKIQVYKLTAVFRDDDHVSDSQALFDACESPGPGMLVHPTRGTVLAACKSCTVKDSLEDKAGETTADMEFVEANAVGASGGGGFLWGIIDSGLMAVSSANFVANYTPLEIPMPWRPEIVATAQMLVDTVTRVVVRTTPADVDEVAWRNIWKMRDIVEDDIMAASAPVVDKAFVYAFATIVHNVPDAQRRYSIMRTLANVAAKSTRMPHGSVAARSEEAVLSRFHLLAGVKLAEAALAKKYRYTDEALQAKDAVMIVFADEAKAAYDDCDNTMFLAIRDYALQFSRMMNDLIYRLPGLVAVNFLGGIHPLVAAYDIYKDAKRHRDLEEKNRVDAQGRFGPIVVGIMPTAMDMPAQL